MATLTADSLRDRIETQLGAIDCAGEFSACGVLKNEINPGLHVAGVGGFGMPLYDRDIQALKQVARQAPFGKGEDTIVDTSIRKTWEIDAKEISFAHPSWKAHEKAILDSVCTTLGVSGGSGNVRAELYKLLVYEEGAHFKPHKDSEKAPGMFATMVICLPSLHSGGDVEVTLGGEKRALPTSPHSMWNTSFLAWYADVTHEVRPVQQGTRVVLTYNLIYTGAKTNFPELGKLDQHKAGLRDTLEFWEAALDREEDVPKFLAWPFEHEYSEASLSLAQLKRQDRDSTRCMLQVAEDAGFSCFLAVLEKTVQYQDDEEITQLAEDENGPMTDIKVLDMEGNILVRRVELPESIVTKSDWWEDCLKDEDEQFTGNAGVEKTYWYKTCGLLFMPKLNWVDLMLSMDLYDSSRTAFIRNHITELQSQSAENRDACDVAIAKRICKLVFQKGCERPYHSWRSLSPLYESKFVVELLRACVDLRLLEQLSEALQYAARDVAAISIECLVQYFSVMPWQALGPCLNAALLRCNGVAKRIECLRRIERPAAGAATFDGFDQWRGKQLASFFASDLGNIDEAVPAILHIVFETYNPSLLQETIVPALSTAANARIAFRFAHSLLSKASSDEGGHFRTTAIETYEKLASYIISGLTFPEKQPGPFGMSLNYRRKVLEEQQRWFTADDLSQLLQDFVDVNPTEYIDLMHQQLASQAAKIDPSTLKTVLMPYLRQMVKSAIQRRIPLQTPSYQLVTTETLANVVYRGIGFEPKPPSLARKTQGCGCPLCHNIDTFLASPKYQTTQLQVPYKKDITHLQKQFRTQYIFRPDGECASNELETESKGYSSPYTFILTKTNNGHTRTHGQWLEKANELQQVITQMTDSTFLRQLLGVRFAEIAQLHGVTLLRQADGRLVEPYRYTHEPQQNNVPVEATNTPSSASAQGLLPNGSLKRTYADSFGIEGEQDGRRTAIPHIIDLSGSA